MEDNRAGRASVWSPLLVPVFHEHLVHDKRCLESENLSKKHLCKGRVRSMLMLLQETSWSY
jgi:hypothetical protein